MRRHVRRISRIAVQTLAFACLAGRSDAGAQSITKRVVRATAYVGAVPYQLAPSSGCGDWEPAIGIGLSGVQRIVSRFELEASLSALKQLQYGLCDTADFRPLPAGTYYSRTYSDKLESTPLVTPDLRARILGKGGLHWELAAGIGWALPPHKVPYTVVAGGIVFGHVKKVTLGAEYRKYHVPYDSVREVVTGDPRIPENYHITQSTLASGRETLGSLLFTLSYVIPRSRRP